MSTHGIMKRLIQKYKAVFIPAVAGLLVAGAVAAWSGPPASPPSCPSGSTGCGTPLLANSSGNVTVAGSVTAASVQTTQAAYVSAMLYVCGGACGGNHTIGAWYDIGASYAHTISNNDTATFTTNGTGRVTVNKTGTYLIRIHTMQIPAAAASGEYACPFINGTVSCGLAQENYKHRYMPTNYWSSADHEFIRQISAGTTVSYGYYPTQTLTDWALDGYTGMEIVRLN